MSLAATTATWTWWNLWNATAPCCAPSTRHSRGAKRLMPPTEAPTRYHPETQHTTRPWRQPSTDAFDGGQTWLRSGDRQCLVLLSIPAVNKIFYVYDATFFLWIGMNTAGICGTTCKMQLGSIQNFQVKGVFEVCMPWCQMTNWSLKDLEILYSTGITVPASSNWPVWVHAAADVANSKLQIRIETVPQETHPITDKCSMHGSGQFGSLSEPTRFRRRLSMMQS